MMEGIKRRLLPRAQSRGSRRRVLEVELYHDFLNEQNGYNRSAMLIERVASVIRITPNGWKWVALEKELAREVC